MNDSEKTAKSGGSAERTLLQAVFDFLKQDDYGTYFGFETSPRNGAVKFLRKSASAEMWFCDVYTEALVEEILKFHAPAHLKHRCADFMNGVNACYSNSDKTNYFDPIAERLENNFERYLKLQTDHLKFQVRRGAAIRQEVPVRNPAKIWSEEAVHRLIREKGTAYNIQTALKKLTVSFFESGVPELFSKEYPEQEELCLRERMENRPELLLELLARILILELKPRPERMKSRLPKSTINKGIADPESHSFRFLKHNVEQVAAAESYVELWRVSRHIGYTLDEGIKLSKTEKKRLDHSVQEYSLAMGMEEEPSINNVKDWIFLLIRAMISDRDRDVERCREHVNTVLDQMLQGKGGDSRG